MAGRVRAAGRGVVLKMEPERLEGCTGVPGRAGRGHNGQRGGGRALSNSREGGCQGWGPGKVRAPEFGDFLVIWVFVFILFYPILLLAHKPPLQ